MDRVLYLDSSEGIFGGGQISLLELLAHVDRGKYHPLVYVGEKGRLEEELVKLGIECQILAMPAVRRMNLLSFFRGMREIFKYARRKGVTLIHSNTSRASLYAGPVAKMLGIPLIWQVRIPHPDRFLDRLIFPLSPRIITVSQAVKNRFDRFKKDKVNTIYNGVDTKKFSPGPAPDDIKARFGIAGDEVVIGTVGRLSPEKGLEHLIAGLGKLVGEYPQLKILFVGNGNDAYRLTLQKKAEELQVRPNIIFVGFWKDIPQIMRVLDIFCLPSLTEGFNRSLLEAMACAVPLVATDVGGNSELVQDKQNGLLVPPGSPDALASAIKELLKDKTKAAKMGQEGRKFVEKNFSIETNVRKTEAIYAELISGK